MSTRADRFGTYLILTTFSVLALAPLAVMMWFALQSGQPGKGFDIGNFARAWDQGHFQLYVRSSVLVSVAVVVLGGALSILAGYAFGTMRMFGGNIIFYVFLIARLFAARRYATRQRTEDLERFRQMR